MRLGFKKITKENSIWVNFLLSAFIANFYGFRGTIFFFGGGRGAL